MKSRTTGNNFMDFLQGNQIIFLMLRLAKDCVSKMVTENPFITGVILFSSAARGVREAT